MNGNVYGITSRDISCARNSWIPKDMEVNTLKRTHQPSSNVVYPVADPAPNSLVTSTDLNRSTGGHILQPSSRTLHTATTSLSCNCVVQ